MNLDLDVQRNEYNRTFSPSALTDTHQPTWSTSRQARAACAHEKQGGTQFADRAALQTYSESARGRICRSASGLEMPSA